MKITLVRIQKVAQGMNQLYSSMDKGFARVETNMALLKRFRNLCYEANCKLEEALNGLSRQLENPWLKAADPTWVPTKEFRSEVCFHLRSIRQTVAANIHTIGDYIEEFSDQWDRSFSLNALIKFKSLLEKELQNLDQEIESLRMMFLLEDRKEQLQQNNQIMEPDSKA